MGRPGTLSLDPIELPDDASSLPPFLATARALVADFEASFSGGAPPSSSAAVGWKTDRHGRRSAGEVSVKTVRGRATGPGVRDLLGPEELWIGRVSEHGPEQGTWDDWQVRQRVALPRTALARLFAVPDALPSPTRPLRRTSSRTRKAATSGSPSCARSRFSARTRSRPASRPSSTARRPSGSRAWPCRCRSRTGRSSASS